jgi:hypothetical protein
LKKFWVSVRGSVDWIDPKEIKKIEIIPGPKIGFDGDVQILDAGSQKLIRKMPLFYFGDGWGRGTIYLFSYNLLIKGNELKELFRNYKLANIKDDPWIDDMNIPKLRVKLLEKKIVILFFDNTHAYF